MCMPMVLLAASFAAALCARALAQQVSASLNDGVFLQTPRTLHVWKAVIKFR
jgi:hypothetical protein